MRSTHRHEVLSLAVRGLLLFLGLVLGPALIMASLQFLPWYLSIPLAFLGTKFFLKGTDAATRFHPEAFATRVPAVAQFILLLIPRRSREHLIGDLEEEYQTVVLPQYGPWLACFWYWGQTMGVIVPYLWAAIKRACGLAVILKLIAK